LVESCLDIIADSTVDESNNQYTKIVSACVNRLVRSTVVKRSEYEPMFPVVESGDEQAPLPPKTRSARQRREPLGGTSSWSPVLVLNRHLQSVAFYRFSSYL